MGGVDDAATVGKVRELTEGLVGFLPTVTAIGGASSGDHRAEREVKFDLAVTAATTTQDSQGNKMGGGLKISVPILSALLSVGGSAQFERTLSRMHSSEHVNRISFSVPIVYATQNDPTDEK